MSEMIFVARDIPSGGNFVVVSDNFEITLDTDLIIFFTGTTYSAETGEELLPIFSTSESYELSTVLLTGKAVR